MHYVKHFDINGVATKQAACIELHGAPNAATEGYVGVLGLDVDSPTHEVYKCVEVRGSIYTWELLSSGGSGGSGVAIDTTLTKAGQAADAKVTGDRLAALEQWMGGGNYAPIITEAQKEAIITAVLDRLPIAEEASV